ncbi:hypothetical protein N9N03_01460, partial [Chlamydiia bacterium]|nr:hypothetical protein [Chlamydiia bacterium]
MSFSYDIFDEKVRFNDVVLDIDQKITDSLKVSLERKFDSLYYRIYRCVTKFFGLSCRFNFNFIDITNETFKQKFTSITKDDIEQKKMNAPHVMDYVFFLLGMSIQQQYVERISCVKVKNTKSESPKFVYEDDVFTSRLRALINTIYLPNIYTFNTETVSLYNCDTSKIRKSAIASQIRLFDKELSNKSQYIGADGEINPDYNRDVALIYSYKLVNSFVNNLQSNEKRLQELMLNNGQFLTSLTVKVDAANKISKDVYSLDYYKERLLARFLSQSVFVDPQLKQATSGFLGYLDFLLDYIQRFNDICTIKFSNDEIIDFITKLKSKLAEKNKMLQKVIEEMTGVFNYQVETKKQLTIDRLFDLGSNISEYERTKIINQRMLERGNSYFDSFDK